MIESLRVRWPATPVTWTEWQYVPVDTFLRVREVCSLPADPQNLRVAKLSQLQLSWSEPAEAGLSWKVYRDPAPNPQLWGAPRTVGVVDQDAGASGVQYTDSGAISDGATYFYLVRAFDPTCGESQLP